MQGCRANRDTSRSRSARPRDGEHEGNAELARALAAEDQGLQQVLWDEISKQYVHCAVCEVAIKRDHSRRLSMTAMNAACRKINCPWPLCRRRDCHDRARNQWIDFCFACMEEDSSFFGAGGGAVEARTTPEDAACAQLRPQIKKANDFAGVSQEGTKGD